MADYVWGIGGGAEMMIRDLGVGNGSVEFWFHANQYTWNNQQTWGYDAGGGYQQGDFRLGSGGGWHFLGSVHIPTSRNVMMRMFDEGLGWPTSDRVAWIPRATVPAPPTMFSAITISTTEVRVNFGGVSDGGSPIREWQIGYGTDQWNPQYFTGSNGLTDVGGLAEGNWWYFWARGRNDLGWGGWSGRAQAYTWRVPDAPSPAWFDIVTQNSLRAMFQGGFDGGTPVREWQLAYGLNPNAGEIYIGSSGTSDLSNLQPGATYYFWARGRNDIGWGGWSLVRAQTLRAGAMVKHEDVWKRALPYVKVNGVWRLAKPYSKNAGVWRETS